MNRGVAIARNRAFDRGYPLPSTRGIEAGDFFAATQVAELDTARVRHGRGRAAHKLSAHMLAPRVLRNEHAPDTCYGQLGSANSDGSARPADVTDHLVTISGNDMDVVAGVAVRLLRIPGPELAEILAIEEAPKVTDLVESERIVRDNVNRVLR